MRMCCPDLSVALSVAMVALGCIIATSPDVPLEYMD